MDQPASGFLSYQKYTFYFLFTLKFPFLDESKPAVFHYIWECVSWISVFLPLHLSVCHMKWVLERFSVENMGEVSNVGIQGIWLVFSFLTMLNFKLLSGRINDLMDEMDATFLWRSAKGKTYITSEKCYKFARLISTMWQITPTCSIIASLLQPLFEKSLRLPSVDWYFFNVENPFSFAVAYLLQSWSQLNVVCSFAVGSTLFHTCCVLGCGQFNILKCSLKNIIFTSGVYKSDRSVVANSDEYFYDDELEDDDFAVGQPSTVIDRLRPIVHLTPEEVTKLRNTLIDCIKHHVQLRRICQLLESCMSFFMLLRLVELTIQICILAFAFKKSPDVITMFFTLFSAFDLFLLTYPADRIMYQNNTIGTSLMMGPWYLVSKYLRNEFIIIMLFTHRPIRFTVGKILTLNADKLRMVLQTAFSYYTLLAGIDDQYSGGQ